MEGRRNLIEYFQSQGYFDVEADFEQFPEDNGVQVIEYIVDRAGRHKLVKLEIDGNKYFDDQTLRERMYIQPASLFVSATADTASATFRETSTPSNSSTGPTDSAKRRSRRRSPTIMRVTRAILEFSCMWMRGRSGLYPRWNSTGLPPRIVATFWA